MSYRKRFDDRTEGGFQYGSSSRSRPKCQECNFVAWDFAELKTHIESHQASNYNTGPIYKNRSYDSYNQARKDSPNKPFQQAYGGPNHYSGQNYKSPNKMQASQNSYGSNQNNRAGGYRSEQDMDYYTSREAQHKYGPPSYSNRPAFPTKRWMPFNEPPPPPPPMQPPFRPPFGAPMQPWKSSQFRHTKPMVPYPKKPQTQEPPKLTRRELFITKVEGFYCKLCKTVFYAKSNMPKDERIMKHCKGPTHLREYKNYLEANGIDQEVGYYQDDDHEDKTKTDNPNECKQDEKSDNKNTKTSTAEEKEPIINNENAIKDVEMAEESENKG